MQALIIFRTALEKLNDLMQSESDYRPYLDGNIIGFGKYHYKYESGREGDSCVVGFSP